MIVLKEVELWVIVLKEVELHSDCVEGSRATE